MRLLLVAFTICGLVAAQQCPPGYVLEGFNTCFSQTIFDGPHYLAYKNCAKDNGFMFEIQNAFQNTQVQSMAKGKPSLWLGMMCLGNTSDSCKWDTGNGISKNSYANFAKGMPNADIGACVYMDLKTGLWYSSDCTKTVASSLCEYTQGITIDYCRDKSLFFQGKCYQAYAGAVSAAWATCKNYRAGDFASIHSAGENSFVRDVSNLLGRSSYSYIPLYYDNKTGYNWMDGSEYSYHNFGYENVSTSSGVAMALFDRGTVKKGQWLFLTLPDKGYVTFVCETYPDHRDPPPTSAPPLCPGTKTYSTDAVITSPGYPQPSVATDCEYVITALPHGTQEGGHVSLFFTDISLDARSTIMVYNDLNNHPIILYSTNYQPTTFYSFNSTLKLAFKTYGGANNFFRAETVSGETTVEPEPSADCNGGTFYGHGEVTSPNYPQPYPPNSINCEYHLHSSADRLVLSIEASMNVTDTLTVIDGNGLKLTFPHGENSINGGPHVNITLTSYTDTAKIVFKSSGTGIIGPYWFRVLFNSVY